jgi:hypothetical protein
VTDSPPPLPRGPKAPLENPIVDFPNALRQCRTNPVHNYAPSSSAGLLGAHSLTTWGCCGALQLSSKTSPSARIIATFTVVDATGGIFLKYLDIPVYARWLCYTNPFFFVMAGLTQIEFTNYEYPGIQQHIVHNYGFDEFSLWQCYYYLGAQYIVYALLGFYLFAIVDMSGKRVVELGYGEAPLVKVAAKLNPFAGKKVRPRPVLRPIQRSSTLSH